MISVPKGNGVFIHSLVPSFTWPFHSVQGLASDEKPDFVFVVFVHLLVTRSLTSSVSVPERPLGTRQVGLLHALEASGVKPFLVFSRCPLSRSIAAFPVLIAASQFPFSLQRISLQTCSPIQVLGRRLALCCAWGGPLCPQAAGLREKGPLQHTWRRELGSDQTPVSTGVTLQAGGSSMHQVHVSGWARVDATCF